MNSENQPERYADIIKKNRTTKLHISRNLIFIGELRYYLYNFFGQLFTTIILITLLFIDKPPGAIVTLLTLIPTLILMSWTSFRDPGIIPKNRKNN